MDSKNILLAQIRKLRDDLTPNLRRTVVTNIEMVKQVFDSMSKPVNIEYIEMPKELRSKYQYHTQADIRKLKSLNL